MSLHLEQKHRSLAFQVAKLFLTATALSLIIFLAAAGFLYREEERPRFFLKRLVSQINRMVIAELGETPDRQTSMALARRQPDLDIGVWNGTEEIFSNVIEPLSPTAFDAGESFPEENIRAIRGKNRFYLQTRRGPWRFVLGLDLSSGRSSVGKTVLILALVMGGVFFLLYTFMRRLLSPITHLTEATRELRLGNMGHRVSGATCVEFEELLKSFNTMADRLEAAFINNTLVIGNVAHDMKSYLARLRLAGEMEIPDERRRREFADDLQELSAYLDRTLLAYRVGSHQATFEFSPDDLCGHIRKAVETVFPNGADDAPQVALPESPVAVRLDKTFFQMLMGNLLFNARKHGTDGALALTEAAGRFQLVISNLARNDLAPADLPLLSQPFFRPEKSRKPGSGGSGLGLFIARQIAEAHGFRFEISFAGGRFAVTLTGETV